MSKIMGLNKKRIIQRNTVWKPIRLGKNHVMNGGGFGFKPVPLWRNNNVGSIMIKNLTWPQAQVRYPRMDPFGDSDRDGKLNMFDCRPFDASRHSDPNINFGFREDDKFSAPERSENDIRDIRKAMWWKKQWNDFHDAKRKEIIDKDVDIQEFVDYRENKKKKETSKRISDIQRARDMGLLDED